MFRQNYHKRKAKCEQGPEVWPTFAFKVAYGRGFDQEPFEFILHKEPKNTST